MEKKLTLKILALILAVCLIGIVLFIINAFIGNPISAAFADRAIKNYVEQNYSSLDLEIEKSVYNFEEGKYMAQAKSKTSIDTHFAIYYKNGKVQRDEYKTNVLGKFNTLSRLEAEYSKIVIPILSNVSGLENNKAMVQVEKWEFEKANENVKIDMKFDKTLPIVMKINIMADLSDNSFKNIAAILENSHKILLENDCVFTSYDIFSESNDNLTMINDVTPSDIESGELEKLLHDAQNYEEEKLDEVIEKGDDNPEPVKRIMVYIRYNN